MMTQAFYTGLSGLKTNSGAIDIVSDNLANIDTIGFRGNNYEFSSLFEEAINTDAGGSASSQSNTVGVGTTLQATPMVAEQGEMILSDRSTDLAIYGDGWFGVEGEVAGERYYTKNGAFGFDKNSDLVTADGYYVLGSIAGNIDGNTLTKRVDEIPLGDINDQQALRFPKYLVYPPEPTTSTSFMGNLGTDNEVRTMGSSVIDGENNKNELKLTFTQAEEQNPPGLIWDVVATVTSNDGATLYDTQTGTVKFDDRGALVSSTLTSIDNNGTSVDISLGEEFTGVVSISNLDITASSQSDGTVGGDLFGYDINKNGEVVATFTNGMQSSVGKIAVYHFQNDKGLDRASGTLFKESSNSGKAIFYKDANGQNIIGCELANFQLEGSNVNMTYGLTDLIILQRAYDANSKSITTADEMMQKALNMDA